VENKHRKPSGRAWKQAAKIWRQHDKAKSGVLIIATSGGQGNRMDAVIMARAFVVSFLP
jgi:hypothetical protein